MNEPVLGRDQSLLSAMSEHERIAPVGWRIRVIALSGIVLCGMAIVVCWYKTAATVEAESPSLESALEPIVIGDNPSAEFANKPVPFSSITSCIDQRLIDEAPHPLIPLLEMANHGVTVLEETVKDYTAVVTKRVRWKGKLQPEGKMFCKIRHAACNNNPAKSIPFSVYTQFITPKAGQEVIWIHGCHDNNLIAHGPTGLLNLMTLHLDPESNMAMNGNRYPIQTIGMLNLIKKMIEKGEADLQHADCKVILTRNVMIDDARCTRLEIVHEQEAEHFEFHRAEIYIDDDRNLPIAFRSYLWPDQPGGPPKLLERYYYTDIKLNVGLVDADFDPANEAYKFPGM